MYCRSQFRPPVQIHLNCDVGVWTQMAIRFSERVAFVDNGIDQFLTRLAQLGGYCTVDQAQAMGLARSPSQTLSQLNGLERAGFLRRVGEYPVVYQITKSVTRLVGTDMSARRSHAIQTVRCRLAAVSFYLDAMKWPADFVFGHDEKIAALGKIGCSRQVLPHRGGHPYLWEEFLVYVRDGSLCVVMIDRPHWTAFLQLLGFVRRFATCGSRAGERLSLTVACASESRQRRYETAARHRKVIEQCKERSEPVTLYQVSTPVPHIRTLTHESETTPIIDSRRP